MLLSLYNLKKETPLRKYWYSKEGIDITASIRDNQPIVVIMPEGEQVHPNFFNIPFGRINKAWLYIHINGMYKLEIS
jgi:hypothetical protein